MSEIRFELLIRLALSGSLLPVALGGVLGYYQFPTIHGEDIVFGAEGDLWQVSTDGGLARRLTTHVGNEFFPRFSPDGALLAFSGEYQGNLDVYVMPAAGGEPRRLTWHPARDEVLGWKPDGRTIIFRSQRATNNREWYLFEVGLEGGEPRQLPFGYGCLASYSPDGRMIAFNRWSLEFRTWKRYRGGLADDIWIGDLETNKFWRMTDWEGDDRFPLWHEGRVLFLSDRDGRMNVYSSQPDGGDLRQHTRHTDFDARWPDAQGRRVVYSLAGDLWLLDLASGVDGKLDVRLPSDRLRYLPRFENAERTLERYELDYEGRRMVLGSRGEIWVAPVKPGRIVRLTSGSAVRERLPTFASDGRRIACITDQTGEQEIALFDVPGPGESGAGGIGRPRILTDGGQGWLFQPAWAPDGRHLAYADLTMTLYVVNVETGVRTIADRSENWEITEYTWSPDGQWLAYSKQNDTRLSSIWLYSLADQRAHRVTEPFSHDRGPAWDPEGRYLYFVGARTFNPLMDTFDFEHVTLNADKLYAVILAADGRSPFLPDELLPPDDEQEQGRGKAGRPEDSEAPAESSEEPRDRSGPRKLPVMRVDLDGLTRRVIEFPMPPGNYSAVSAVKNRIFYVSSPLRGLQDGATYPDAGPARNSLHVYDLRKRRGEVFIEKLRDYCLSGDGRKLAYRGTGEDILVIRSDSKPGDAPDKDRDDRTREKVSPVDLPLEVDPAGEWSQIFRESWRLQRDFYWAENMAGVDWDAVYRRYEPLVGRVSTRAELNDLIGQLIAELGTSHTYVSGGDLETAPSIGVGLLGADLEPDPEAGRLRFARILRPEVWESAIVSPLTMTHANVRGG